MRGDRLSLLADARLPGDARIMGMLLIEMGEGWHEVPHDHFRALLPDGPSDDTIRRHLRRLEGTGWIEVQKHTGRRPPQYRVRGAEETPSGRIRTALAESLPLTTAGQRDVSPAPVRGKADEGGVDPAPVRGREPLAPHPSGAKGANGGGVGGGELSHPQKVEEKEKKEGARDSAVHPLSRKAEQILRESEEKFNGCRGALRDYLEARVPTKRQHGYLRTVEVWLDGGDPMVWKPPGCPAVPEERRTGLLASALNNLLGSEEEKMKRPVGDPDNLRTKLEIIQKRGVSHGRSDAGGATSKAGRGQSTGGGDATNPIRGDPSRRRGRAPKS